MKETPGAILARLLKGEEKRSDRQKFIDSSKKVLGTSTFNIVPRLERCVSCDDPTGETSLFCTQCDKGPYCKEHYNNGLGPCCDPEYYDREITNGNFTGSC